MSWATNWPKNGQPAASVASSPPGYLPEGRGHVADLALPTRAHQHAGVGAQRVQVREHPSVAGGRGGRPVRGPYQAEAVAAGAH